jgi:hypothetical protein
MGLFSRAQATRIRYLVEVPHDPDECGWIMDEIIGRGPQYAQLFWWGCHVGDHRAWTWLDGEGREAVLEEALPPVLRQRALVHRVSRIDGPELRDWHEARGDALR